jgi:uncharacterized protein (DUF1501 family)
MTIDRRKFLQLSGLSLAALGMRGEALARRMETSPRRLPRDLPAPAPRVLDQLSTKTVLMVFLRGGADGLNHVVPTESGEYATYLSYRPGLAVDQAVMASAGTLLTDASGADLQWGLHPNLAPLMPLWSSGAMAILPDVHYANGSRSHFDSQQYYENGTPQDKFTPDGWANRHLATTATPDPLLRAVAFDTITPFALQGAYPALTFSNLNDLSVSSNGGRNGRYLDTQEIVYPTTLGGPIRYDREVSEAGSSLVAAIRSIEAARPLPPVTAGVTYPSGGPYGYFGDRLRDLASLIKSNRFQIEFAEVDLYGWDTHNAQDNAFPTLTDVLGRGLRAFVDDLTDQYMQNVVIVVMTEFGRTSRENGSAGTDHGSAMATFVLGHPSTVLGRRVVTSWAGLDSLREDRDLQHSFDFRDVLSEVVMRHYGNASPTIFPDYTPTPAGIIA